MNKSQITFSSANAKLVRLQEVAELVPYLAAQKRRVYSLDLTSGWSCPGARECKSQAVEGPDGRRHIMDGPHTEFRCFSASQEAQYTGVYALRKANFAALRTCKSHESMAALIHEHLPPDLGICRLHVAGDFYNSAYLQAWVSVATMNHDRLFYAYTKSLPYWLDALPLPPNLVLTASRGGVYDDLIEPHGLRSVRVVYSEAEAAGYGLQIDHDDSHAVCPSARNRDFALLLHGTQPRDTRAAGALKILKREGTNHSYSPTRKA